MIRTIAIACGAFAAGAIGFVVTLTLLAQLAVLLTGAEFTATGRGVAAVLAVLFGIPAGFAAAAITVAMRVDA